MSRCLLALGIEMLRPRKAAAIRSPLQVERREQLLAEHVRQPDGREANVRRRAVALDKLHPLAVDADFEARRERIETDAVVLAAEGPVEIRCGSHPPIMRARGRRRKPPTMSDGQEMPARCWRNSERGHVLVARLSRVYADHDFD